MELDAGATLSMRGVKASKSELLVRLFAECNLQMSEAIGDWFSKSRDSMDILAACRDRGGHTVLWELLRKGSLECADLFLEFSDKRVLLAKTDAGRSLLMVSSSLHMLTGTRRGGAVCV